MLVERGKFRTTTKYFLEWSVDDGMKTVLNCLGLRSSYRCGSRTKQFDRSEFLIDTSLKKCLRVCPCVRLILVLVSKTLILVNLWSTYYVPATYVVCGVEGVRRSLKFEATSGASLHDLVFSS